VETPSVDSSTFPTSYLPRRVTRSGLASLSSGIINTSTRVLISRHFTDSCVNAGLVNMALTFRKIILFALLIAILLHEPTFKLFVNLLVNAHIFSRITLDIICDLVDAHFPTVASLTTAMFHDLRAFVSQRYEWVMSGLASLGHSGLKYLASWTITWLKESPRWLCEMNEFIVAIGEGALWRLQGDGDGKMMEGWIHAAERLTDLCVGVRSKR